MKASEVKLTRHGQGDLGARDWGKEGDGLYASARHLRASALVQTRRFERYQDIHSIRKHIVRAFTVNTAFPKAFVLLLGYCVEMYLKAGLTKQLIGCADDVFRSTLRSYSHKYDQLATDLLGKLSNEQINDLKTLSNFVLNDARYPIEANTNEEYVEKTNRRAKAIYNGSAFRRYCHLAKHIRAGIGKIDNDSSNPCSTGHWSVDNDGYLCYRYGGNLPQRITYRRCTASVTEGPVTWQEVADLVSDNGLVIPGSIEDYQIYADQEKTGKRILKKLS